MADESAGLYADTNQPAEFSTEAPPEAAAQEQSLVHAAETTSEQPAQISEVEQPREEIREAGRPTSVGRQDGGESERRPSDDRERRPNDWVSVRVSEKRCSPKKSSH